MNPAPAGACQVAAKVTAAGALTGGVNPLTTMLDFMAEQPHVLFPQWHVASRKRGFGLSQISPPQLFIFSFLVLVGIGTLGFRYLPGLYTGPRMEWVDCLFTATSAVCITGLTVIDTGTYLTPLGQAYLLLLFQLGGFGIIAFTSLIIVALGRRLSLRSEALSTGDLEVAPHVSRRHLLRDVFLFTLIIEAMGAILLYVAWGPTMGWRKAIWPAVFHSVSAFCNAGFSTQSDSLMGFQTRPATLLIIGALIVIGGIGFLTMEEMVLRFRSVARQQIFRVSIHSKIVLATTAVLLLAGWVLLTFFEWNKTLAHLSYVDRLVNGLFLSITPRSGGFNNIDYTQATAPTSFLTILLMTIGGSPGSTAGGIKTTTFALLGLLAWSRLRGNEVTSVGARSIPEETIQRAVGLAVIVFTVVTLAILLFCITESHSQGLFLHYMFEAASAFNTVGLSMGITPTLSDPGKWNAVVMMFVGRVGTLTVAAALARPRPTPEGEFRYAYEDVVVG